MTDAMNGRRDKTVRNVLASYVEAIEVMPSSKSGVMLVNAEARQLWERNDRPEGQSWANVVAGARAWIGPRPPTGGHLVAAAWESAHPRVIADAT